MSKTSKTALGEQANQTRTAAQDLSARCFFWLGLALVAIAAVIRALWLGRPSYWIDEINIIRDAMNPASLADIYRIELERFQSYRSVPFPPQVLRLFLTTLGFAGPYPGPLPPEWAPRLLSLLAGLCAIPIFGALGRDLANRRVGLWAMFLCAFSVYHAWYCRDVRVYGLMITLLTGTLWTGLRIAKEPAPSKKWWAWAAAYTAFASAYLASSLNTIFFLLPWSGLILIAAILRQGVRQWFDDGRRVLGWLLTLAIPFLLYGPFLIGLFGYNIKGQAHKLMILSLRLFPAILGRMGWGEAWYALLPFSAFVFFGAIVLMLEWRRSPRALGILIVAQGMAFATLQAAAQWLSDSGVEVRYFMGVFPILLLLAAVGLERFACLSCFRRMGGAATARAVAAILIAAWSAPNLWFVVQTRCQAYTNYKAIAEWVNKHVQPNGAYAFFNIYELRGVPMAYETPQRAPTSVAIWSGVDEFFKAQPARRAEAFFRMCPEIPFIEIGPADLLYPEKADYFIPRETLFARHAWLEDAAFEKLIQLKTNPLGDVQDYNVFSQRILVSWNEPEDLRILAKKLGRRAYHRWGPEWRYARDPNARHWMAATNGGTMILGNATEQEFPADLSLAILSPAACRLEVSDSNNAGNNARSFDLPAGMLTEVTIPGIALKPGTNVINLRAFPSAADAAPVGLYVNDLLLK